MIPLYKPYMPKNINKEVIKLLYSDKLSFGKYGRKFEEKLSDFLGTKNILTVGSYNHALLIVLSTLGLSSGDEVIASPVSCLASNQPFVVKGLKIIWADVDPNTGSMLVEDVRSKINLKTKAIFHNHFCGYLGNIDEINSLAKEHGITVVDDCIEAFGSELNGKKAGNLGTDITVFSFQTVRLPNTINGGAIVFKNKIEYEKAKKIRDYGIDRNNFRDSLNEINFKCDIKLEGYGALMNEISSFIGFKQMDELNLLLEKQRKNADFWNARINNINGVISCPAKSIMKPNYWIYGIIVKNKIKALKEFRSQGFYASGVHMNNNIYSVFNNKIQLKGVTEFMNHFIALPCGWWFNLNDIEQ